MTNLKRGEFVSHRGSVYWEYSTDGERVLFAEQMGYDYPTWSDLCSGTAVIDVSAGELTGDDVSIDSSHPPDVKALEAAQRALESYRSTHDDYRANYRPELWEVAETVAKRAGVDIYGVSHYGHGTVVTGHLYQSDYLCLVARDGGGDYHGREYAAMCNGHRFGIFVVPATRLEQWISDDWGTWKTSTSTDRAQIRCTG